MIGNKKKNLTEVNKQYFYKLMSFTSKKKKKITSKLMYISYLQ